MNPMRSSLEARPIKEISKVGGGIFEVPMTWGRKTKESEIARPIFTPPGSFAPKNGDRATIGPILISVRKKSVSAEIGDIWGRLKMKLT